jgi:CheY-like chemotaxis protein
VQCRAPLQTAAIGRFPGSAGRAGCDGMALALIIEDNPGEIDLLREAFRDSEIPIELHVASTATEAFAYMRRIEKGEATAKPDFILLDMNLPAIRGDQVLEEVRRSAALKDTPVIVWTSGSNLADLNSCKRLGANEIHVKPLAWKDYVALIAGMGRRYALDVEIGRSDFYELE